MAEHQNSSLSVDTKPGLLDESTYQALLHINIVTLALASFGVVGNGVNMAVFAKQGFRESMNISLFTLALSDFNTLLWVSMAAICVLPGVDYLDLPFSPVDIWTIVAWQATSMVYGNCWLAAFISLERCLSIAKPLHVKSIITRKVTIFSVVVITLVCMLYLSPLYATMSMEMKFDSHLNKSLLHLVFSSERATGQLVAYMIHIFMQVGSFVTLLTATIVLVIALKRKTKWRNSLGVQQEGQADKGGQTDPQNAMSSRDKRVSSMVILISSIIIVCVAPGLGLSAVAIVEPEFEVKLRYERSHIVCWCAAHLLHAFNSSVNVIVYFNMSSRFRETLQTQVLCLGSN